MTALGHRLWGNGPHRVMALHGWLSDGGCFEPLWDVLDPGATTWCVPDARGYGRSRHLPRPWDLSTYARDALALADSLGWTSFSAVGHSMGGMAAQRMLVAAPGRVSRVVGIAPVPASGGELSGAVLGRFQRAVEDVDAAAGIIDGSTGGLHPSAWVEAMARRAFTSSGPEARAAYLDDWADVDFHEEVEGSDVPVRLLLGRHDPSLTPARMERTWQRWYRDAEVFVIDDAGHYPAEEAPQAVADVLHDVLVAGR